jgi:hypothetical protein
MGQEGMLIARDGEVVNSPRELLSEKLEQRSLLPKKSCKLAFRRLKKYYLKIFFLKTLDRLKAI